ncbi:hypothetical protein [Arsukibacterium sp.]|uniref:hypothetical protein n=1 Tax=Arsukibacterium sp. TaxID=1977258 RepID=UPI00299E00AE|nr:hypothetical protein [Arsukibacterium sp.]MDX1677880.1 hypothetical protein [Arsukibacterium sp.]
MTLRSIMCRLILLGLSGIFVTMAPSQAAVPEQCIQHKKRIKACPHQLYRADKLPSQKELRLICICVTDFQPLLQRPGDEQQRIEQNMLRRQYLAQFGDDLPVILAILQHHR